MKWVLLLLMAVCAGMAGAADGTLQFAEGLARRGRVRQAAQEYEAILKKGPNDDASFALAGCYEKLGRDEDARRIYRDLAGRLTGERQAAARLSLAVSLLYRGDRAEEARTLLEAVAAGEATAETRAAALLNLGRCQVRLGRMDEAQKVLAEVVAGGLAPYASQAKAAQAEVLLKGGDTEAAWQRYREALADVVGERRETLAAEAFGQVMGAAATQSGDAQTALYGRAAELAKWAGEKTLGRSGLLMQAAYAAYGAKRPDEAKGWLEAEKRIRPTSRTERLFFEGLLAEALGDAAGALTAYERVLAEFPDAADAPRAAQAMLVARARAGEPKAFLEAWRRVSAKLSREARLALEPARLDAAMRANDLTQARESAAWQMDNAPAKQAADAGYRLGLLEHRSGAVDAAAETWLRVAERWPSEPMAGQAAYAAATVFAQAKQSERMEAALRAALGAGDASVTAAALLFRARTALAEGDVVGATAALDEYLTRFPEGEGAAEAAYWRGLTFFNQQDFQAAEGLFAKALAATGETGPKPLDHARRTDAALRRALALHALGRSDEAAEALQPIVALKDAQSLAPEYLAWLAEFRMGRKEWALAEEAARALVARGGKDKAWGNLRLGQAAEARGQAATALAAYEAVLAESEGTIHAAEAALGLGRLRAAAKEWQAACEAYDKTVRWADVNTPDGLRAAARAHAGLAQAHTALGEEEAALREHFFLITCFDDATLVPAAFRAAIATLEAQGHADEAQTLRAEFAQRYPAESQK